MSPTFCLVKSARCILFWTMVTGIALSGHGQDDHLLSSHNAYVEQQLASIVHLQWQSTGPFVNSARAESIQLVPSQPGMIYLAFGSGSVWKSSNNGISWTAIFEDMPTCGIGDIAVSPSDPNVVYIGTGESLRKQRNFTIPGNGVYRSSDGGATWEHRGLENNWHTGELVVHPSNPDIVLVAAMGRFWSPDTTQGIYRTTDGGLTWEKTLYINDRTRANDVVFAPSDPQVVYATVWDNNPDTVLFESIHGPSSGIYRSEDGGVTWNVAMTGLPQGPRKGRIGIAVSHQDAEKAYALIDNHNNPREKAPEIYRTLDGGESWQKTHTDSLLFASVIGWYFSDIYCSPTNDEEIFALGVRLAHSTDGGQTFSYIEGDVHHLVPSPAQTLHLDQCELYINPQNASHLSLANDGGLYTSYDKGQSWLHHNNLATGEYYTMTIEQKPPYRIMAGSQDNATVISSWSKLSSSDEEPWSYLWIDAWSGGDGCVSAFDPDDSNVVFMSMQNGAIRQMDLDAQRTIALRPLLPDDIEGELGYNFVAPYFISQHSGALYHGGNFIFKSEDRSKQDWRCISPDLSASSDSRRKSVAAGALVESPISQGLLYVGTDHGACWRSDDDGASWSEISEGLGMGYIRSIQPSHYDDDRVYLTMTGLNYDDLSPYVYCSEDRGRHWKSLSSNLPRAPVNVILEDPMQDNILYLGSHQGVFVSLDRGGQWSILGSKLPRVAVADLGIIEDKSVLLAATHGRGIYMLDLAPFYTLADGKLSALTILPIDSVKAPKVRSTHSDIDRASLETADIYFYSPEERLTTLSIFKAEQKIFQEAIDAQPGLNHFRWDLVLDRTESNMPYYIHYEKFTGSGMYTVVLNQDDTESKASLLIY